MNPVEENIVFLLLRCTRYASVETPRPALATLAFMTCSLYSVLLPNFHDEDHEKLRFLDITKVFLYVRLLI
jgi:hypothetical protein